MAGQMLVGTVRWTFRLREVRSLKDKRRVSSRIRDRVRAKFPVAISEVEGQDDKRRLVMGVATVGNDAKVLRSTLDRIAHFVEDLYLAETVERQVAIAPFEGGTIDWGVDVSTLWPDS